MNKTELKTFMDRHELGRSDVAKLIGVSEMAVNHWIFGNRAISLQTSRILKLFDKKPELMEEFVK